MMKKIVCLFISFSFLLCFVACQVLPEKQPVIPSLTPTPTPTVQPTTEIPKITLPPTPTPTPAPTMAPEIAEPWKSVLEEFFSYVNQEEYLTAARKFSKWYVEEWVSTYSVQKNIENHIGYSNIKQAKLFNATALDNTQTQKLVDHYTETYQKNATYIAALITAEFQVYNEEENDVYRNGVVQYYTILVQEEGEWKIFLTFIPQASVQYIF